MSDFIVRLYQERNELHLKIEKLEKFLLKNGFGQSELADENLMYVQKNAMLTYFGVLNARLNILDPEYKYPSVYPECAVTLEHFVKHD